MSLLNLEKCTGCGACMQACPISCIKMQENEEGFMYPLINEDECIHCNKCKKTCPIASQKEMKKPLKCYAAITKSKELLKKSTSGGLFGVIAEYIISRNGVVYGCAYEENLSVRHIRVADIKQLSRLRGSKYVQSNTGNTFLQVKEDLENEKYVLYTGTPCQIAGLKKFLKKNYNNLFTIDIICHGTPSESFFLKYIRWLEQTKNVKLLDYNFRSKDNKGWGLAGTYTGISQRTGKVITKKVNYFDDYYYYYFLKSNNYRNSCYTCDYANINREGDFTLGDFWGIEGKKTTFKTIDGCSVVLINTLKALQIFNELDIECEEVSLELAIKFNKQLTEASARPTTRTEVLRRGKEWSAEDIQKKFIKEERKERFKGKIKYSIPKKIKGVLLKMKYKRK